MYSISTFGQSKKEKKDIKANKIKSVTENVTEFENGKEVTRKDSYTSYDKDANILLNEEFKKDGTLKHKEAYVYDSKGNKLEVTFFDAADAQPKAEKNYKLVSKYDIDNNKTEELEYSAQGKQISKTQYSYNTKGYKVLEVIFDTAGKLTKKTVYTYDSKGLRGEKKEYNGANTLLNTRKYTYQY